MFSFFAQTSAFILAFELRCALNLKEVNTLKSALRAATALQRFDFTGNLSLVNASLVMLCAPFFSSFHTSSLRILNLSKTGIQDEGAEGIAALMVRGVPEPTSQQHFTVAA
jgi:hypothetical protein